MMPLTANKPMTADDMKRHYWQRVGRVVYGVDNKNTEWEHDDDYPAPENCKIYRTAMLGKSQHIGRVDHLYAGHVRRCARCHRMSLNAWMN